MRLKGIMPTAAPDGVALGSRHPFVDRQRMHGLASPLLGKQGDPGVFITTSALPSGTQVEAARVNVWIELIDGARVSELTVKYERGVQMRPRVAWQWLHEDFVDCGA